MTERERLLTVYKGETPDRVPFFLDLSHWFAHKNKLPFDLSRPIMKVQSDLLDFHKKVGAGFYMPNGISYYDAAYGNQEFLAEVGVQLNQVYRLYGKQSAFSYLMHGSGHSFPEFARSLSYAWLDRFLR